MAFSGSCHCGGVKFTVEADLPRTATSCNCSHCRRKGILWSFYPAASFRLETGDDLTEEYRFNTLHLGHKFCKICGTQPFAVGRGQDGSDTRAVNVRCVPLVDLEALEIRHVNGAAL